MMRQVSKTSRPLITNTPIAEMNRLAAVLWTKRVRTMAARSTNRPTMKNPPQALKSRRLITAYSESTPNAPKVRIAASLTMPGAAVSVQASTGASHIPVMKVNRNVRMMFRGKERAARCAMISGTNEQIQVMNGWAVTASFNAGWLSVNQTPAIETRTLAKTSPYVRRTRVARSTPVRTWTDGAYEEPM